MRWCRREAWLHEGMRRGELWVFEPRGPPFPFTPKSEQILVQISPEASPEIQYHMHSMKNCAFHSLLGWKMIILLPILNTSLDISLWELGRMCFCVLEWNGPFVTARPVSLPHDLWVSSLFNFLAAQRKSDSRKKLPSRAPRPSITVSDFKTSEEAESPGVGRAEGNLDRLCPNAYYSYRRHSSPSALGETAEFEFPSSPDGVTNSQPDELPSRHSGRRNQSSPFLSRGSVRTRAQSSSSDFGSNSESRSYLETWSCIAPPTEEVHVTPKKFQLQSPPKRRTRSRGDSVRDSSGKGLETISGPTSKTQTSAPLGRGSPAEQDNPVSRAKRKVMNAIGLGTPDSQSEEGGFRPPRTSQRSGRGSMSSSSPSSGILPLDWLDASSEETSHDGDASAKSKGTASPCRLYKIVKEAEERATSMTTAAAAPTARRQKSPSTSPLSSPRCPRSPVSPNANAGVVVTSSRPSRRRSSISVAAAAFAAATAGASSPSGNLAPSKFRFGKWRGRGVRRLICTYGASSTASTSS